MKAQDLQGSIVALVTPMYPDGRLDMEGFCALIDWHVAQDSSALVIAGTTGESSALHAAEYEALLATAVSHAKGRLPIIAGSFGHSTQQALQQLRLAQSLGVSASLQLVPYYNKPTQEGLYQHFRTLAEEGDLPIILYNVPGRTLIGLDDATILRLAMLDRIIGLKDASADFVRASNLLSQLPLDFALYSGDDGTALALMFLGAKGCVSVVGNVVPHKMQQLCRAALAGNWSFAKSLHFELFPLSQALFSEANPIPVKWALHAMKKINAGIRLPLTPLREQYQPCLSRLLSQLQLLA